MCERTCKDLITFFEYKQLFYSILTRPTSYRLGRAGVGKPSSFIKWITIQWWEWSSQSVLGRCGNYVPSPLVPCPAVGRWWSVFNTYAKLYLCRLRLRLVKWSEIALNSLSKYAQGGVAYSFSYEHVWTHTYIHTHIDNYMHTFENHNSSSGSRLI